MYLIGIMPELILVNTQDQAIGRMEKLAAHQEGRLHRALSVFIFNSRGEYLIQKRADAKYHSAGLWSNTACSHPLPQETSLQAANRRLREEMGLEAKLEFKFKFMYRCQFDSGLVERELDHVFTGICDEPPQLNPQEAADFQWISLPDLKQAIQKQPERFTFWFRHILANPDYLLKLHK